MVHAPGDSQGLSQVLVQPADLEEHADAGERERGRYKPSPRLYSITYQTLIDRDGNRCAFEGCTSTPPFHIHHKYHDTWNWRIRDLQLMCEHHDSSLNQAAGQSKGREREGEKMVAVDVDEAASMEVILAVDLFPLYRGWLWDRILAGETVTKKAAIYDGAMYLKDRRGYGSSQTTRRYLNELTAKGGPFMLVWDPALGWKVVIRERRK